MEQLLPTTGLQKIRGGNTQQLCILTQPECWPLITLILIITLLNKKCWGKKAFLEFWRIMKATALSSANLPSTDVAR